ncbi:2-oxoglutarate-dependent dioxygenase DAO-like [Punica granatum]|uniref:2-oxoglutarate-dependent dioxygenase DAO n=1 Tax=Punica granatum TaxID=22663 RepID=A0A6P8CVH8_PUNGR|nr:2-oxoglutarate-dependent dioxygenase DAO-like [Punica granatum]
MGEEGRVVPVIDMQELPFHYAKLREACQEWGCFRVVNHGVPVVLMSEMKRVGRSLLDLPIETKKQNVEVRPGSGYIAPGKVNAIYESLYLSDLASPEFVPAFCSQLDADPENRELIEKYVRAIRVLALDVADKVAKSLDLSGGSNLFERWPCHMRMNKYSFAPETVGNCGVPVHSDSSFLTLLQDDDAVGGLEIFDNKSGSFLAVQPCPSTFFVNLGDLAVVWSNGRFSSVKHQVQCTEGKVRVSIGTFMFTPGDAVVEAPEELIDSQNPRLYVPFTCGHYRKLRGEKKMYSGEALSQFLAQSSAVSKNISG